MLVVITRTFIILFFLVLVLRLMGKREIAELQPFEFVITLVIAELACTPMQDISIPLSYGLIPIFVVFICHFAVTKLATKFIKFRKVLNGKPVIVINENGIDIVNLKKINMNVNDLMQSLRLLECFSIPEVKFGIVETNGNLSVLKNDQAEKPQSIPLSLVIEGKYVDENIEISNTNRDRINGILEQNNLKLKDVVMLTTESNNVFIQPKNGKYLQLTV